jgi:hypothetical protein
MSNQKKIRELIATIVDAIHIGDLAGHLRAWRQTISATTFSDNGYQHLIGRTATINPLGRYGTILYPAGTHDCLTLQLSDGGRVTCPVADLIIRE